MKKLFGIIFIILGLIIFPLGSIHLIFVVNPLIAELDNYAWESGLSVGVGFLLILIGIGLSIDNPITKTPQIFQNESSNLDNVGGK